MKLAPHISWNRVDGELALFDTRNGRYHLLNHSSAEIWRGIADQIELNTLAETLATKHSLPVQEMAQDVDALVSVLLDSGLLIADIEDK